MTQTAAPAPATRRVHPAWWAAAATFLALLGAAAFRATPSVMIEPLRAEFGWSIGTISVLVSDLRNSVKTPTMQKIAIGRLM